MADITKCSGEGCPLKDICYRFTAKDNSPYQWVYAIPPIKDGKCEYYVSDVNYSKQN